MRLIYRGRQKEGDKLVGAWLSFGKMDFAGWYVSMALCLPKLCAAPLYDSGPFVLQHGWWIPRVTVVYDPVYKLRIAWCWEFLGHFMGVEHIERYDRFGHLLNCPRCNGHILEKLYKPINPGDPDTAYEASIKCCDCKYEYEEPTYAAARIIQSVGRDPLFHTNIFPGLFIPRSPCKTTPETFVWNKDQT